MATEPRNDLWLKLVLAIQLILIVGVWGFAYSLSLNQSVRSERLAVLDSQFSSFQVSQTLALVDIHKALKELEVKLDQARQELAPYRPKPRTAER